MVPLADYQKLESEIVVLKHRVAELQRLLFGAKSERFIPSANPAQLQLELEGLEEIVAAHTKMVAAHERRVHGEEGCDSYLM